MQTHIIDGHTVNSSFDFENTESMLRSFLAIAQASMVAGFDELPEKEQEEMVQAYFEKPLPAPSKEKKELKKEEIAGKIKDPLLQMVENPFKEPFILQLDDGQNVVIHGTSGQWFVLLEREMLTFHPPGL